MSKISLNLFNVLYIFPLDLCRKKLGADAILQLYTKRTQFETASTLNVLIENPLLHL